MLYAFFSRAPIIFDRSPPFTFARFSGKCLAEYGYGEQSFPETEKAAHETLALPIYPELTCEMQEYVVDRIAAFYEQL